MNKKYFQKVLGIRFFTGVMEEALDLANEGGLILAPSGPGLADLPNDPNYKEAFKNSDLVLVDSGMMVLTWWLLNGKRLRRISGLKFLKHFLEEYVLQQKENSFWVMPDEEESAANREWLKHRGISVEESDCYIAPLYKNDRVEDSKLLALLKEKRPNYIIINIGGGVQEKLGAYLRRELGYKPTIICTGAAIAFLTGRQARIPWWADRLFIGWLVRCISSPNQFIPRYWNARRLFGLLRQNKENSPLKIAA